ncbi:protein FAN-like [Hylaeus anthracinus]|uniref:protein FAN-like n=1 Tax=Hylaeus volcanicus TaxID=313075 RepID=UPI0023B78F60|nr:protein FAN-like [Hylaeus volcanicus]XP_054010495.1 protein FAN-like [Hylaeus anthracinus]
MEKERFTMLLLEPGEIFFEDYSVQMKVLDNSSSVEDNWIDGRLKLCSKSLVFVSKDINQPLVKIQLKEATEIDRCESDSNIARHTNVLSVKCKQYVQMLEKNILAPYKFIHEHATFYFHFNYAKVEDCLPQILQLLRAATLPTAEQNAMIMTIVHSRQSRVSFDTSWLEDLYEQVVLETQANKVLPLVINPGRILLTNSRIYFQPYNNLDQHPVLKIQLKDIINIIKRRFILKQVGLEIKWLKQLENKVEHLFISLRNQNDRDELYTNLLRQPAVSLERVPRDQMTMRWQNGSLSNYDYLLYINSLADRTFHDLTQYPVMPWVIQDYSSSTLDLDDPSVYRDLSKPIGALEPNRLQRLKERYTEMPEPKFLYGSHYSAPGFVLFYLVRKYPQYMLCLQNGRFDHPDRMFNSVADVWKNVLVNMSDFKELVPEFYDTNNGGDFLVNSYGIDFGYRHDGTKIGDVQLPAWANGHAHFVQTLRNALENDYVSQNLHHWIDLIFGYKQRGSEAVKADNIFFHLCYEGAVDLDTIRDVNDRHGLEVQIMEFGQIPKQIFNLPHPKRSVSILDRLLAETVLTSSKSRTESETPLEKVFQLHELMTFQSHKESVSSITMMNKERIDEVVSVGQDGMLKLYSIKNKKLTRSVALSSLPLSSCISYYTTSHRNILVVGSWDNSLIFYDLEFGRVIDTLKGHEDAVSCLVLSSSRQIIVSGSWDCTAKVWQCYISGSKIKPTECLIAQLDHDSKVTCINISRDEKLLVSGTEDGEIFLWNMDTYNLQFSVKGHTSKVNAMVFDEDGKSIISCAEDKVLNIIDVHTSTQIYYTTMEHEPLTLTWLYNFLLISDSNGNINVWNHEGAIFVSQIHYHDGPIHALAASAENNIILTGGKDKKIVVWGYKKM